MKLLYSGKIEEAEKKFHMALKKEDDPSIRNNIAFCKYLMGKYEEAFTVLKPSLDNEEKIPYVWALAAQIKAKLGELEKARIYLENAMALFNWGVDNPSLTGMNLSAWNEYIAIIQQSAGVLNQHDLGIMLHKRWEKLYQSPDNYLYAGISCYNLKMYKRAIDLWEKAKSTYDILTTYINVTKLIQKNLIPHFPLEYNISGDFDDIDNDEDFCEAVQDMGQLKMIIIDGVVNSPDSSLKMPVSVMVEKLGPWGIEFGKSLLKIDKLDNSIKMTVAVSLTESGVYKGGDKIPVITEGREQYLQVKSKGISHFASKHESAVMHKAIEIAGKGRCYDAINILEQQYLKEEDTSVSLLMLLAKLYYVTSQYEKAEDLVMLLLEFQPGDSSSLLLAAEIYYAMDEEDLAWDYLVNIDEDDLTEELRDEYYELMEMMEGFELADALDFEEAFDLFNLEFTEDYSEKDLPKQIRLLTCLRALPVEWLNAIYEYYELPWEDQRKDREKRLAFNMVENIPFGKMIEGLTSDAKGLLKMIVEKDGICKMGPITKKYGSDEDTFWWTNQAPTSPLGQLRVRGLVFVGKYPHGTNDYKTAAIPVDLFEKAAKEIVGGNRT